MPNGQPSQCGQTLSIIDGHWVAHAIVDDAIENTHSLAFEPARPFPLSFPFQGGILGVQEFFGQNSGSDLPLEGKN